MSEIIRLEDIRKVYGRETHRDSVEVLSGVNLSVRRGGTVSVSGPSGSGKSTLLNIMGALTRPTDGRVFFRSREISGLSDKELSVMRNRKIGFIFQMHHLLPQCSVIENVLIPTLPYPEKSRMEYLKDAAALLESVGLSGRAGHKPSELSGGERLRTAVARALINRPEVILADEPTGSLDAASADEVGRLILEQNRERDIALVVVTHSRRLAALMSDKYLLKNGSLEKAD